MKMRHPGTRRGSSRVATTVVLGAWLATASRDAAGAEPRRQALLIANQGYQVEAARLKNPLKDALLLERGLKDVGFSTRLAKDLDRKGIKKALDAFLGDIGEGDVVLLYYSGHGISLEGRNYLLGVRFDESNPVDALDGDVYPVDGLVQRAEATGAGLRMVVVDACRNEPFTQQKGWRGTRDFGEASHRGFEPVARTPAGEGTLVAFAAAGKQRAFDRVPGLDGGPYAHALVEHIRKPGLDVRLLFSDVGTEVKRLTGNEQTPEYLARIDGRFYFVPPAAVRVDPPRPSPGSRRSPRREESALADFNAEPPRSPQGSAPRAPEGMVVVPAGRFFMGCNEKVDRECYNDEKPGKTVHVDGFFIDRTEVTVSAYAECVRAKKCTSPIGGGYCNWGQSGREQHPINCVGWEQARDFCAWQGKRLPTEAEWEKAARGTDGQKYPWGNEAVSCRYAVLDEGGNGCGRDSTWPVGSKPEGASPYGALDMVGNVSEWTADWYTPNSNRAVRGGCWSDVPRNARASNRFRNAPSARYYAVGFRCLQSF